MAETPATTNKLEWDKEGSRGYETGVSHGVLYPKNSDSSTNAQKPFNNGVAWNGLTSVQENPDGADPNDLYADNIKYMSLRAAENFKATIEAYTYPDEFARCDGSYEAEGAKGLYLGQQPRESFGFSYQTKTGNDSSADADGYKIHIVYNASASPSSKSYETVNDSPEAITFSWEIETTPMSAGDKYKPTAYAVIDSRKTTKECLAKVEAALYGDATNKPYLPSISALITMMTPTST